jgi:hypothetical protein
MSARYQQPLSLASYAITDFPLDEVKLNFVDNVIHWSCEYQIGAHALAFADAGFTSDVSALNGRLTATVMIDFPPGLRVVFESSALRFPAARPASTPDKNTPGVVPYLRRSE